jgi:hypothetical protein
MAGCRKRMEVTVQKGYGFKDITVKCGNTSPDGTPWLCSRCEKIHAGTDWRREAELNGEAWGPEDY